MNPDLLKLDIAIARYGHTSALLSGDVPLSGINANFLNINPIIAAFRRMVRGVEFDVCEMAPATYMIARSMGAPFKALPIFIMRRFHHSGFVVQPKGPVFKPKDLEGRNTGGSQFFICHNRSNTKHLDGVHTCFGRVIEGLDVLDNIVGGDKIEKMILVD